MEDKASKQTDMDRIGLFKEMSYLHGSEHVPFKVSFNEDAHKEKQLITHCTVTKDGTRAGYFDEFRRCFEGEGYMDYIRIKRQARLESSKKNLEKVFKPSSSTKEPCGLGSTYGTFSDYQGKIEAFSPAPYDGRTTKSSPVPRNIVTNPGKKGSGYSYPNITIGAMPPYLLEKDYEVLKNLTHEAKRPEPKTGRPFFEKVHQATYFDPNPFFTEKPVPIYRAKKRAKQLEVPFVPSGCGKTDGGMKDGCFEKYPEYKENAYLRPDLVRRGVRRYVNKENKMFLPVPAGKGYPIKSIIDTNINKSMNITNFATTNGVVYCKK